MPNDQNLMDLEALEQKYKANTHNGIRAGFTSTRMIPGTIPVLIDAPHSVRQQRNHEVKASDAYTGAMTEWLCARTGAYGCIRFFNDMCDPNYDSTGRGKRYRIKLGEYCRKNRILLVVDLHGSANPDIVCDIGINGGKNLCNHKEYIEPLTALLSQLGEVSVDGRFRASKEENISWTMAREYGIPSFQMEIGSRYRKIKEERMRFLELFSEYLIHISENLT